MRLLVCGGRDFVPRASDYAELASVLMPGTTLIHGGAQGADRFAAEFAKGLGFIEVIEYAADWRTHGRAGGPLRNSLMLVQGKPDAVLAFRGGKGTADMVCKAEKAGIPVRRVP